MRRIRVLVVEDSLTVRKHLVDVLSGDPEVEIVGEAEDGKRGIELCQQLRPDVITLDMMMPVITGVAATEYIMAYCPTPILIVSASTNRGEVFKTYEALAAGAVEVLDKPDRDDQDATWNERFLSTVKLVSRVKVITHLRSRLANRAPHLQGLMPTSGWRAPKRLVAVGTSSGGPGAIIRVFRDLPTDFPLPILLVIHIGKPFGHAFAEWLESQIPFPVSFPKDGQKLPPVGRCEVLMAPPDQHMVLRNGTLRLTQDPERHSCRPSVDVLFESVAKEAGEQAVACLLTGMGKDGAAGLLSIRQRGGVTFAQDEASSTVFGMPREAILLGGAEHVLALDQFGQALAGLAGLSVQERRP